MTLAGQDTIYNLLKSLHGIEGGQAFDMRLTCDDFTIEIEITNELLKLTQLTIRHYVVRLVNNVGTIIARKTQKEFDEFEDHKQWASDTTEYFHNEELAHTAMKFNR